MIKSTGDGILATFDTPTRAIRCAIELLDGLAGSGLKIRAAIHTGEIELLETDVGGIGVHIASRVLGEAGDDEVVVTRTVRDLATGTDLAFAPSGRPTCEASPVNGSCSAFPCASGPRDERAIAAQSSKRRQ